MSDPTPLPNPPCGAISPDGNACPSDSIAVVASEWPMGHAMAVLRCHDHVGAAAEAAVWLSPKAPVIVTPLAAIGGSYEPGPDSPQLIR